MPPSFTKNPIPDWLMEMQDGVIINAIETAMPFGALTVPGAATPDELDVGFSYAENSVVTVNVLAADARATETHIAFGDGAESLIGGGTPTGIVHDYVDTLTSADVVVTNNAGQSDTITIDPRN